MEVMKQAQSLDPLLLHCEGGLGRGIKGGLMATCLTF